ARQKSGADFVKTQAGLEAQIARSRKTLEIIIALLRNDMALMCDFYAATKSQLIEGKLRGVGTSGLVRTPFLPDVPPVAEAGVPGYEVTSWNAMCGPAGMPADVVALLNRHLRDILSTPVMRPTYT